MILEFAHRNTGSLFSLFMSATAKHSSHTVPQPSGLQRHLGKTASAPMVNSRLRIVDCGQSRMISGRIDLKSESASKSKRWRKISGQTVSLCPDITL
ncbi:hypothetical protein ACVILI_000235 [Mesorhizobium sp. USDA 4775]